MVSKLCILGLALCFALAAGSPAKIVGGEDTTIDRYPSIVQVEFLGIFSGSWSQSCAASILTSRYILSAAHCFDGVLYSPQYRRIRAGATYRNTGGFIYYIEREFNHPSYGPLSAEGDISVVRLSEPVEYNPVVQAGVIVSQGTVIPDNVAVVHAGWGATSQGGAAATVLQDVIVYTVNNELCTSRYNELPGYNVTPNMICVGLLDVGGKDACQGDSGGPLYYGSNSVIVGVVSWGEGCANARYPGVNTAVASYTNWIVSTAV